MESNGALVSFWGTFDYKTCIDANMELYGDSSFEGLTYVVWDLSNISEQKMTKEEAALVAMHDKLASSRLPKLKMAILARDERTRHIWETYIACCQNRQLDWAFLNTDNLEEIRSWIAT